MPTSTLRAVILLAAVVVGIFGIAQAFPENGTQAIAPSPGHVGPSSSPSPSTSTSPRSRPTTPSPSRKPKIQGVVVLVLNGSGKTGQASLTSQTLKNAGYTVKPPGNSPQHVSTTVVYYAADSQIDAQALRDRYFPNAQLKPATSTFPTGVDVEVVLGLDFASSSP